MNTKLKYPFHYVLVINETGYKHNNKYTGDRNFRIERN